LNHLSEQMHRIVWMVSNADFRPQFLIVLGMSVDAPPAWGGPFTLFLFFNQSGRFKCPPVRMGMRNAREFARSQLIIAFFCHRDKWELLSWWIIIRIGSNWWTEQPLHDDRWSSAI
jgi:hypothetical protein